MEVDLLKMKIIRVQNFGIDSDIPFVCVCIDPKYSVDPKPTVDPMENVDPKPTVDPKQKVDHKQTMDPKPTLDAVLRGSRHCFRSKQLLHRANVKPWMFIGVQSLLLFDHTLHQRQHHWALTYTAAPGPHVHSAWCTP